VFVGGSAACGLAPNETVLIVMRGFQAIGAAMLFATSPAILIGAFPPHRRGQVLACRARSPTSGSPRAPCSAGLLAKNFGWPAIFFINVPIGLGAIILGLLFIKTDRGIGKAERFDFAGAVTFLVALVALTLALDRGSSWGWSSAPTLGLLALAVVLLAGFIVLERRTADPMLDLTLFASRTFSASTAAAALNYVAIYTVVFLMPFYLENGRDCRWTRRACCSACSR